MYFLDEMSQDEISCIYRSKYESDKTAWEQVRVLSFYSFIAMQGNEKVKKPEDLFPLKWDSKGINKPKGKRLTKEEAELKASK